MLWPWYWTKGNKLLDTTAASFEHLDSIFWTALCSVLHLFWYAPDTMHVTGDVCITNAWLLSARRSRSLAGLSMSGFNLWSPHWDSAQKIGHARNLKLGSCKTCWNQSSEIPFLSFSLSYILLHWALLMGCIYALYLGSHQKVKTHISGHQGSFSPFVSH